jgi:hypothetical protein
MWIDDDFPALALMNPGDFMAQAKAEVSRQWQKTEDRKEAAMRDFAQLSARHQLTGYDRNMMQQWLDSGACGQRPPLSFELRRNWKSEQELALERRARSLELQAIAHEAAERVKRRDATKRLKSEKVAASLAAWDAEHPDEAAKREQRKGLVRARRAHEEAERKLKQQAEDDERRRQQEHKEQLLQIGSKIRAGGKQALLELDEQEFDLWCQEIATTEQLEAFGSDLLKDGKALREQSHWFCRLVQALGQGVSEIPDPWSD